MLLRQIVGPATYPVSLDDAKRVAVVDFDDDDELIESFIATASRAVGEMAGRVLTDETWALSFPNGQAGDLVLPKSPVQSVSSITYFDGDDVEQTATVSDFYLISDDDRAYLRPKAGTSWPAANQTREDAITVTFVAGYTSCPETLKTAILLLVSHLNDNRSAASAAPLKEIPFGLREMIGMDRLGWVGS